MKTRISLATGILVLLVLAGALAAQTKLTFAVPDSKYRKIDKTGSIVGDELWKRAKSDIGVGNFIFSTSPVPFKKEAEYQNVGTKFQLSEIKELNTRVYFPATKGSIVKYIEEKNPGHSFAKFVGVMQVYRPSGGSDDSSSKSTLDEEDAGWDTQWFSLFGENDFCPDRPLSYLRDEDMPSGEYELQLYYYAHFDTGKTKFVTRAMSDGSIETQEVSIFADVLIAYGECNIIK